MGYFAIPSVVWRCERMGKPGLWVQDGRRMGEAALPVRLGAVHTCHVTSLQRQSELCSRLSKHMRAQRMWA